jgi:alpha-tubulin suppressor-like RCC1 family protein
MRDWPVGTVFLYGYMHLLVSFGVNSGAHVSQSILTPEFIEVLDNERIFAIAAGAGHTVAVSRKSQLFAWGQHQHGQLGLGEAAPKQLTMPVSLASRELRLSKCHPGTLALPQSRVIGRRFLVSLIGLRALDAIGCYCYAHSIAASRCESHISTG